MRAYLHDFLVKFDYPEEARTLLENAYQRICADEQISKAFQSLLDTYEKDKNCNFNELLELMTGLGISFGVGMHEYTGYLLLVICLSRTLKRYYQEYGISEEIWETSMYDIKWKTLECKDVYNIYGTFVAGWYAWFFSLQRFGFEKLQFEVIPFGHTYEQGAVKLNPKSKVLNVHIPRTGARLDRESVQSAYKQGIDFFKKWDPEAMPVFVCESWLLYPRNKEILSPQSNLYAFLSDYDIIEQGEDDTYWNLWRLFDKHYRGNVEELPQNSSLRRAYADWVRKGDKIGWGFGVYPYENV